MGNRPINRRPFRRRPWAKGKKRPTRWNASTNSINEDFATLNTQVPLETASGVPPLAIIADGQLDVEPWADDQEVTVDRIVGSLLFWGWSEAALAGHQAPIDVILKLGIVLNEELTAEDPAPIVNRRLFDQEDLEDTEWMWLHAVHLTPAVTIVNAEGLVAYRYSYTLPIDLRNRRKIGQRDELALYAAANPTASGFDFSIQSYTDVRCILMSR